MPKKSNTSNDSRSTSNDTRSTSDTYSRMVDYFEENKHKPWYEWLEFKCTFGKQGRQGLVGLLKAKTEDLTFVFKIPQDINYLAQHESTVLTGLNSLYDYCPHYARIVGMIQVEVDPMSRKSGNPFKLESKYKIMKDMMLLEYIDNSVKLATYIRSSKADELVSYSIVKQVLMAVIIGQREKKFVHNDLHSSNILIRKCNKDVVFLYALDEMNQFAVPTRGYYPVIIDPGFAYIEDFEDGPMWMSLGHTDGGMMSDRFDLMADAKLFLITISGELKDELNTRTSKKLRNVVKNVFSPLSVDWFSGHDKPNKKDQVPAADMLRYMLNDYSNISQLFVDKGHFCIDILQSLIVAPLQPQSYANIDVAYKAFMREWIKIENEVTNQFFTLYILKGVVDAARHVCAAYHEASTRKGAVVDFKREIWKCIDSVVSFCRPKNLNAEVMLCSLLALAKCMEGVLYKLVKKTMDEKEIEYSKMPLTSVEQIYGAVDANLGEKYKYSKRTVVCVFDCVKRKTQIYSLPVEYIDSLNKLHHLASGSVLYDIYKNLE